MKESPKESRVITEHLFVDQRQLLKYGRIEKHRNASGKLDVAIDDW